MQQMPAFAIPTDAYQARCVGNVGIGNLGIGTGMSGGGPVGGKQYKVHGNVAFGNFNNYVHNDQEMRGMTRIVFNGNNNRNDFHCGADSFQNCIANDIMDNTGSYQLNFMNTNGNMRYIRQQINPSFQIQADNQMQRCYIQRPQGQRYVRVGIQGSKMRPNGTYRNFNNHNNPQRQKQNRRFVTKGFNNYNKAQKCSPTSQTHPEGFFNEEDVSSSPQRCTPQQEYLETSEKEMDWKTSISHNKQENQHVKSNSKTARSTSLGKLDSSRRSNKASSTSGEALLEPKVEYMGNSLDDLSYDDISENSDDNNDSADLRERLMRKKHDQTIKREPGELASDDDDDSEILQEKEEKEVFQKRKTRKRFADENMSKRFKNSEVDLKTTKESKKSKKVGRSEPGKSYTDGSYLKHDNRITPLQNDKTSLPKASAHKVDCSGSKLYNNSYTESSNQNYCCVEAEVVELKEKMKTMKKSLREAQDKLLEVNVVTSKKALRMQEEMDKLKRQLEDAAKAECDLKASLKTTEKELSAKNSELTRLSLLNEEERQEQAKSNADMNRTYKERLIIEVEKLRALFDVEVAKMQAYYMSTNIYDDEPSIPFAGVSSDNDTRSQQSNQAAPNNGTSGTDVEPINANHGLRDVSFQRNTPFVHAYFNTPSQTSAAVTSVTPFSLFENVMAYNSLVHHQHIYAKTTASSRTCAEGSGSNSSANSAL